MHHQTMLQQTMLLTMAIQDLRNSANSYTYAYNMKVTLEYYNDNHNESGHHPNYIYTR